MTDPLETRRKRALYRANHRGTMEMDWLLGRFAESHLKNSDADMLDFFERFLEEPDPSLQNMILGKEDPHASEFAGLIYEIRKFHDVASSDIDLNDASVIGADQKNKP